MSERKQWTQEEDRLLEELVSVTRLTYRLTWTQIAESINTALHSNRNSRQCRERWVNQLRPDIDNISDWTEQEKINILRLQQQHGNKWSTVARHIQGRSDNSIKNFFYSALKKSLKKVNKHITANKSTFGNMKVFKENTINKILQACEGRHDKLVNLGMSDIELKAKQIKKNLVACYMAEEEFKDQQFNQLALKLSEFNKNCRKPKSTKTKKITNQKTKKNKQKQTAMQVQVAPPNEIEIPTHVTNNASAFDYADDADYNQDRHAEEANAGAQNCARPNETLQFQANNSSFTNPTRCQLIQSTNNLRLEECPVIINIKSTTTENYDYEQCWLRIFIEDQLY